jgi:hypothetical protein
MVFSDPTGTKLDQMDLPHYKAREYLALHSRGKYKSDPLDYSATYRESGGLVPPRVSGFPIDLL